MKEFIEYIYLFFNSHFYALRIEFNFDETTILTWIKWTFELFCALISLKFGPFFPQNSNFFIHRPVSGTFLHVFSH